MTHSPVDPVSDGRVRFAGPRTGADLARIYVSADVLVLPSRAETYGMVVTEALARGWEGRDSRSSMILQKERSGLTIKVDPADIAAVAAHAHVRLDGEALLFNFGLALVVGIGARSSIAAWMSASVIRQSSFRRSSVATAAANSSTVSSRARAR
jgi:glycosyltransferase involved in cell wall biosynthesis